MSLDQPPIDDSIVEQFKPKRNWVYWFNALHRSSISRDSLINNHLVLNPDFHWSRTNGNNPTTSDGEFVEQWSVSSEGMGFIISPFDYSTTQFNSQSGSQRYVNIVINAANSNKFHIYQRQKQGVSLLQNKDVTFSFAAKSNTLGAIRAKFRIDFDLNNDGTSDYFAESKEFLIEEGFNKKFITLRCPQINDENPNNHIWYDLILSSVVSGTNFDLFFIKPELTGYNSPLYVDHTLEKLRIDNK